jgi:chemotaxis protein MotB
MAKKHSGHHGGSWKVAYADFVTAMMALFLCLWLTAQDAKIKDAVERAFRNPFAAVTKESVGIIPNDNPSSSSSQSKGDFSSVSAVEMSMIKKITEDLAKMLQQSEDSQKSVQLEMLGDGLRINVFDRSQKPIFEADSDAFTTYGGWVFSTLAWEISRYSTFRIELEGHTEARPLSGREAHSKWELSTERANAARRKLVGNGVNPSQVFKVAGFADTQPMPDQQPTAESNRRVTVMLKVSDPNSRLETAATGATGL